MRKNWKLTALGACLLAGALTTGAHAEDQFGPPQPTFWAQGEYLLWFLSRGPLSTPLVTSTAGHPTNLTEGTGVLGDPGTNVLYGNGPINNSAMNGFRITAGVDLCLSVPIECSYFQVYQSKTNFNWDTNREGFPVLSRPFFQAQPTPGPTVGGGLAPPTSAVIPPGETVALVAFPSLAKGGITITSTSRIWGFDPVGSYCVWCDCMGRVDVLAGFRYQEMKEDLDISSISQPMNPNFFGVFAGMPTSVGTTTFVQDSFHTENRFYGGEMGVRGTMIFDKAFTGFSIDLQGKFSLGENHQSVQLNGASILQDGRNATVIPTGLLVEPSNGGRFSHQTFSSISEMGFNINYDLNRYTRLSIGYNAMYWTGLERPGSAVNRTVDTQQVVTNPNYNPTVGVTQPTFHFQNSDVWLQGLTVGLLFCY